MKNDATQVTLSRWTSEAMTAPTPTLRAQVLALRRTQSARAEAQALSIPLRSARRPSSGARKSGKRCIRRRKRKFWVGKLRPPRKPLNAKTAPKTSRSLPQRPPPSPVKPSTPSTSTWLAPKPLATTCPALPAPAWTRAWSWTSERPGHTDLGGAASRGDRWEKFAHLNLQPADKGGKTVSNLDGEQQVGFSFGAVSKAVVSKPVSTESGICWTGYQATVNSE